MGLKVADEIGEQMSKRHRRRQRNRNKRVVRLDDSDVSHIIAVEHIARRHDSKGTHDVAKQLWDYSAKVRRGEDRASIARQEQARKAAAQQAEQEAVITEVRTLQIGVVDVCKPVPTFLSLTEFTTPHRTEFVYDTLLEKMGCTRDACGNWSRRIGETRTMFTAHMDTADSRPSKVVHKMNVDQLNDLWVRTDGGSILGADDKAGMTVLLYMMAHEKPGLYYFFVGEEVGCIGSSAVAAEWERQTALTVDRVISFDRHSETSVITHQIGQRCCSDDFAHALANRLNNQPVWNTSRLPFMPDSHGAWTDSEKFTELVAECTNISVGYEGAHTRMERQNLTYLQELCEAVVGLDWETLPTKRDPKEMDMTWREWSRNNYSYRGGPSSPTITTMLPGGSTITRPVFQTAQQFHKDTEAVRYSTRMTAAHLLNGIDVLEADDVTAWVENNPEDAGRILHELFTCFQGVSENILRNLNLDGNEPWGN